MYNKASCTNKIHARYIKKKEGEDVKMMNFISLEAVERERERERLILY